MTEQTPQDTRPEQFRGGAAEPDDAKSGAGSIAKGVVPDQVRDSSAPPDSGDDQELKNESHGDFSQEGQDPQPVKETAEEALSKTSVDLSAGDDADATSQGQSGGARGSEASLGRHDSKSVDEEDVAGS
jgi:hypothetical protein